MSEDDDYYEDDYIEDSYSKKSKYKKDKEHTDFSREAFISSKFNTFLSLFILGGLILLPMAISAELTPSLNEIQAQIAAVQNSLTEYYIDLQARLISIGKVELKILDKSGL